MDLSEAKNRYRAEVRLAWVEYDHIVHNARNENAKSLLRFADEITERRLEGARARYHRKQLEAHNEELHGLAATG